MFSNTFDNNFKTLSGLLLALLLGPIVLQTGVILDSFKESGNLFFLMSLVIQLVSSKNQVSLFFSMFTGIYPTVALFEGMFFTTFLTVASQTYWKENFLFNT